MLIFIGIALICLVLSVLFFCKSRTHQDQDKPSGKTLWKGKCDGKLSLPCTGENNCSVLCKGKFITQGNCSSLKDSCIGSDCTVECEEPKPVISCSKEAGSGYESIWTGKCKNGLRSDCKNESCIFYCGESETPVVNDTRLSNCQAVQSKCDYKRGVCTICCKPKIVPTAPGCPGGAKTAWTGTCSFLDFSCSGKDCTAKCNGLKVYQGNCQNSSTSCQNGACSICCSDAPNPIEATCKNGREMARHKCDTISSFCVNGECSFVCDGVEYPVPECHGGINTYCSNDDCVVCC